MDPQKLQVASFLWKTKPPITLLSVLGFQGKCPWLNELDSVRNAVEARFLVGKPELATRGLSARPCSACEYGRANRCQQNSPIRGTPRKLHTEERGTNFETSFRLRLLKAGFPASLAVTLSIWVSVKR